MAKVFPDSRWESENGELVFWLKKGESHAFGYIYASEKAIPIVFESYAYGCNISSVDYYDGERFDYDWDKTVPKKDAHIELSGFTRIYRDGSTKMKIRLDEDSHELAASLGLPETIKMHMAEQNLSAESMQERLPPILPHPHQSLYLEYKDLFLYKDKISREMNYEKVTEKYGVCDKYYKHASTMDCYYAVDEDKDGEADFYWNIEIYGFANNINYVYLISPEQVPADAVNADKNGAPPSLQDGNNA